VFRDECNDHVNDNFSNDVKKMSHSGASFLKQDGFTCRYLLEVPPHFAKMQLQAVAKRVSTLWYDPKLAS